MTKTSLKSAFIAAMRKNGGNREKHIANSSTLTIVQADDYGDGIYFAESAGEDYRVLFTYKCPRYADFSIIG